MQQYPAPLAASPGSGNREVILDFAALGTLASINVLVDQNVNDGNIGSLLVFSGIAAGTATGWLLTESFHIDAAAARMTTLGMMIGTADGALLIEPTHETDGGHILGYLTGGGVIGALAGLAYGQNTELTPGQSMMIGNLVLLGSATAALSAISISNDGNYGGWENGVLALGMNGGVLAGALIAPKLDWSPRRSRLVLAGTLLGAFVGGVLPVELQKQGSNSASGDLVTGCMTAGMWGGFGLSLLLTREEPPDIRFQKSAPGSAVTLAPYAGGRGQVGMMAAGTW